MRNYSTVLKIAPAFLLAGTMLQAQVNDSTTREKKIEEVVLIGYGSKKKSDLTGSVTALSEKDFNKGAIVSADQLITGKAPGVRITNSGGQPDAAPNIRIRGGASLSANNNPLIVIDGIPMDNTTAAGMSNPLNIVNPNDIESFSILKDASATAIYGSRASNGVIIITTKKGSNGKLRVNYNGNVSFGQVTDKVDVMDGDSYRKFMNEYNPAYISLLGTANTNWQDQIYRKSFSTDHNLSLRGNLLKVVPARLSFGYNKTQGVLKTNDYERFTGSIRLTPTLFDKHLKIDINAKGMMSDKNAIDEGGAIGGAISANPTIPVFDSNGGYFQTIDNYVLSGTRNPLAVLEQRTRPEKVQKLLGNVEFDYKMHFLPELRAVLNLGLETSKTELREYYADNAIQTYKTVYSGSTPIGGVYNSGLNYGEDQTITNKLLDAYLVYSKNLNGLISKFDVQGGYSYQNFENDGTKDLYDYNPITGIRFKKPEGIENVYNNELNLQSFFGRSNFDILNKYLFTFSYRADASSLFQTQGKQWGHFPAMAFAWKMNEEDWINSNDKFSDLKLRLGWGRTGQQDITGAVGFYPSTPVFQQGFLQYFYFPNTGLYTARPYNKSLTWEKTTTYNTGIDFSSKSKRVSGSVDYYNRYTTDLLAYVDLPPGQSLVNKFADNVGSLKNHGVEFSLNLIPVKSANFTWELNGNMAYNRGKVNDLEGVMQVEASESRLPTGTGITLAYHAVGQQPYSALVFEQVYDSNGRVIPKTFVDRNSDGKITDSDKYYVALRPNWTYGFSTLFNIGKVDLTAAFRGQIGGKVYNSIIVQRGYTEASNPANNPAIYNVLNFYNGASDDRFTTQLDANELSDYFLEDATFLRCDNITLGYTFDKLFGSAKAKVYGSVNNAFIVTKYSGQDPENFNAIDNNFYPRPRIYTLGLNLDF